MIEKLFGWLFSVAILIFGPIFLLAGASTESWGMVLIGSAVTGAGVLWMMGKR